MKREKVSHAGWLVTLLGAFLLCIASLLFINARVFNATIDQVVQDTFDNFMHELTLALAIVAEKEGSEHCSAASQQILQRAQIKIQPALRISVVRNGKIWCDSDPSTLGSSKPSDWATADPLKQGAHLFATEQSSGGVMALTTGTQATELVVLVTPLKYYRSNQFALWSLSWTSALVAASLIFLTALMALILQRRLHHVFDPELDALDLLQTGHVSTPSTSQSDNDLLHLAQRTLHEMDQEQARLNQKVGV